MAETKRQLAAIMFTDIVGYTTLMGKDSRKALELVHQSKGIQKPLVEKYNGKWLKEMGDGVLSKFDSALDAVNCAVEIQKKARAELGALLRIGIHIGDIAITENDIYGDGVNIASRVESVADPGGIYISESVEKSIRGQTHINIRSVGKLKFKNVSYPVNTYALQGDGLPKINSGKGFQSKHFTIAALSLLIIISSTVTALVIYYLESNSESESIISTSIIPSEGSSIELIGNATVGVGRRVIDISDDGKKIAYIGGYMGNTYAYVRDISDFKAYRISATEGAYACRFSPNSKELAYLVGNSVWKVTIDNNKATKLADASNPMDIYWQSINRIYYSADEGNSLYLFAGDESRRLPDENETLYVNSISAIDNGNLLVRVNGEISIINTSTLEISSLGINGYNPLFLESGYLVYTDKSTLYAIRLDSKDRKPVSEPFEIETGIREETYNNVQYDVSKDGTLVYISGEPTYMGYLSWVYNEDSVVQLPFPQEDYGEFKISPNGEKIVATIFGVNTDIWIFDLNKNQRIKLTTNGKSISPAWYDDQTIFLTSINAIYRIDASKGNDPILILEDGRLNSISKQSDKLIYYFESDLHMANINGTESINLTSTEKIQEFHGSISPDGKLIAYTSDRSEAFQVYLQKTKRNSQVVQISIREGSEEPRWTSDGKHIIYRSGQKWMKVKLLDQDRLETSKPELIAEGDFVNIGGFSFDVSANGDRLLVSKGTNERTAQEIRVVQNWSDKLRYLVK